MRLVKWGMFVVMFCVTCSGVQGALAQEGAPGLEPKAAVVYKNLCSAMDAMRHFSVQADVVTDTVFQDGTKVQFSRKTAIDVRRPDHFRTVTVGDDFTVSTYYNGKTFALVLPESKRYGTLTSSLETNALLDKLSEEYGLDSPLGDLLMNNPCAATQPEAGFYVGKTMVDGVACHHLLFQGEEVDWQLWVEDSGRALPRKLVITEKLEPKAPQFTAVFRNWSMARRPDSSFSYVASDGCTFDSTMFANATAQQAAP